MEFGSEPRPLWRRVLRAVAILLVAFVGLVVFIVAAAVLESVSRVPAAIVLLGFAITLLVAIAAISAAINRRREARVRAAGAPFQPGVESTPACPNCGKSMRPEGTVEQPYWSCPACGHAALPSEVAAA